jgi:hypothetical protein
MKIHELANLVENLEFLTKLRAKLDRVPQCKLKDAVKSEIDSFLDMSDLSELPNVPMSSSKMKRASDVINSPKRAS